MKNKLIAALFLVGLLLFFWMQKVYLPGQERIEGEVNLRQLDPETHDFEKVLKFKNPYMGNASNNINLNNNLPPLSDLRATFEQKPEEFKFIVNYVEPVGEIGEEKIVKAIIYNSTAFFVLINNLEILQFSFPDHTYTVTRERVNDWFGEDVTNFGDRKIFSQEVQQPLVEKEQLADWFDAYRGGS